MIDKLTCSCIFVFLLLVPVSSINAQPQSANNNSGSIQTEKDTAQKTTTIGAQAIPNESERVLLLEQQNRLLSEHNDKMLLVTQWSLTFAATFLLVFLGLVGYLTNRRYEQDKETLQTMLGAKILEAQIQLDSTINRLKDDLQTAQNQSSKELKESLKDLATSTSKSLLSSLESRVKDLANDLLMFKYDVLLAQAEQFEEKKDYTMALDRHFDIAKIAVKLNWEWMISNALKNIERFLALGGRFNPDEILELNRLLRNLSGEYEPLVKGVQARL
jgi:hypothetical protein